MAKESKCLLYMYEFVVAVAVSWQGDLKGGMVSHGVGLSQGFLFSTCSFHCYALEKKNVHDISA